MNNNRDEGWATSCWATLWTACIFVLPVPLWLVTWYAGLPCDVTRSSCAESDALREGSRWDHRPWALPLVYVGTAFAIALVSLCGPRSLSSPMWMLALYAFSIIIVDIGMRIAHVSKHYDSEDVHGRFFISPDWSLATNAVCFLTTFPVLFIATRNGAYDYSSLIVKNDVATISEAARDKVR